MLTKIDINKLKEAFVTKDEFKDLKNDIVTFKDEVLHEIIKLRDDITVVIGYRDMIEDHEQRIIKLEKEGQN
jgi:hypothetical protein